MLEERMRLLPDKTQAFLEYIGWGAADFANALDLEMEESYKLLSGEPVNYYLAKRFIWYFSAAFAKEFIDWDAMKITAPRLKHSKKRMADDVLFSMLARDIQDKEKEKKYR